MTAANNYPLITIVGPTASGKSALAIDMAEKYNGEIICADSRTIFREMNIGTAKPNDNDRRRVPHWGLDLVNPGEYFSAADFKKYTIEKIDQIRARGHVPFLVGGTGLYVDSVLLDYQFGDKSDVSIRKKFELMSIDGLHSYCENNNIIMPENFKNKRYLIRAIELNGAAKRDDNKLIDNCIVVGISTEKSIIMDKIDFRIRQMIDDGVVAESVILADKYGWDSESMKSNIYPVIRQYTEKQITLEQVVNKSITIDWHLAKRQITWLKRNKFIRWFELDEAREYLDKYLASVQ